MGVLLCNDIRLCISMLFVGECLCVYWFIACYYNVPWICSIVVWKSYHVPVSVCTGVLVRFGRSWVVSDCRLEHYWFVRVGWSGRGLKAAWNNGLVSPGFCLGISFPSRWRICI
jgi:hypothetical protein